MLDNDLNDVFVKDLLPPGFTFNGTWKVTVNGVEISVPNPNYGSPGTWNLGDLKASDEVIIEYPAIISNDKKPGLYKDVAWALGTDAQDNTVLALAQPEGYVDTNFVGTDVKVVKEQQNTSSINIIKEEQGEVLGVSLPATGGNTIWVIIASIASLLGLLLVLLGLAMKKNKLSAWLKTFINFVLILVIGLFVIKSNVSAANLSIRLSEPKSPTNINNFDLNFVTLDLNNNPITVKCFYQKAGGGYSQFGPDINLAAGGNNGSCQVSSSQIDESGKTYTFYTTAYDGSETVSSEVVSIDYNTSGPSTPVSYSKEHPRSCDYKIKFKTADDAGKTVKVEIYRSENTSFGIDASNRVGTVSIGSNQEGELTNSVPDCNKTYYYAIRAYDSYGNGSGVIGDSVVKIIGTTTIETTPAVGGAIPVTYVTLPAEGKPEVLGKETGKKKEKEEVIEVSPKKALENILGAATKKENRPYIIIGGLLALGIIGYGIYVYKKRKA